MDLGVAQGMCILAFGQTAHNFLKWLAPFYVDTYIVELSSNSFFEP